MKVTVYACVGIPMEVDDKKYNPLKADWFHEFPDHEYDSLIDSLCEDLDKAIKPTVEKMGWKLEEYASVKCNDGSDKYLIQV